MTNDTTFFDFFVSNKSEESVREKIEEIFDEGCDIRFEKRHRKYQVAHVTQQHILGERKYLVIFSFSRKCSGGYYLYIGYTRE